MQNRHLSWSPSLSLPSYLLRVLWSFRHDARRAVFRAAFRKRYWNIMQMRQGKLEPYNYDFCEKHSLIYVHIPKAAGMFISRNILDSEVGHLTVSDYQIMFGSQIFEKALKFAIVRNPWDRLVSAFHFLKAGGMLQEDADWANEHLTDYADFKSFVRDLPNTKFYETWIHFVPQYKFLTDPCGRVQVDFIGHMENMDQCVDILCDRLQIAPPDTRSKENPSNHRHYAEYYDPETVSIVERIYREDIDLLGYKFGE